MESDVKIGNYISVQLALSWFADYSYMIYSVSTQHEQQILWAQIVVNPQHACAGGLL